MSRIPNNECCRRQSVKSFLVLLALGFTSIVSHTTQACMDEPLPYVPLVLVDGQYVERPDLLTQKHINKANTKLPRCAIDHMDLNTVRLTNGVFVAYPQLLENKRCIAEVTMEVLREDEAPTAEISLDMNVNQY